MKKLFTGIFILISFASYSQKYTGQSRYGDSIRGAIFDKYIGIPTGCGKPTISNSTDSSRGALFYDSCNKKLYLYDPKLNGWDTIKGGGGGTIAAGAISSLPTIGFNPGSNITSNDFITNVFYQSQPPTSSLTGGFVYEFTTAGTQSKVLNWSGGRSAATTPLATINVDGVNQTFTQPSQGASVSGTKTVTITNNSVQTFTNTVTTTDGKIAVSTTQFSPQNKIYAGFVTSATPTDADIFAATGSAYVGGTFSASINQSGALSTPSSSKYFIFAAPASYGTPNVNINGLGVSFNLITRSFTNASGFTSSYTIAVSPNSTAGAVASYIIN